MSQRILLVEDEPNIRKLVKLNLEMEDYEVDIAVDGKEAIQKVDAAYYDIVILDLMLPEIDGMQVLNKIKLTHPSLPVIITSARDTSADRIEGLKSGAEDYLNKPFHIDELLLRIQKLITRNTPNQDSDLKNYNFGENNTINFQEYHATGRFGSFKLTKKEALMLKLLISKKNEAVTREEMFKNIWGYDVFPSTRTIDNFILSLRKQFEVDPKKPKHFISIRGVGYKFVP